MKLEKMMLMNECFGGTTEVFFSFKHQKAVEEEEEEAWSLSLLKTWF